MIRHSAFLAVCTVVLLSAPLGAQDVRVEAGSPGAVAPIVLPAPMPAAVTSTTANSVGPTTENGIAGVRTSSQAAVFTPPVVQNRVGRNPAMMIVGGAALVVGAVIGGDAGTIVMVGGAVVGLLGLWNYLR